MREKEERGKKRKKELKTNSLEKEPNKKKTKSGALDDGNCEEHHKK